jgi:trimeric autotransporter adhesin
MRTSLRVGIILAILFATVNLHSEPKHKRDIGDGGLATDAKLIRPTDVAIHNRSLYIVESGSHRVRMVNLDTGIITTIADDGGGQCVDKPHYPPKPGCLGFLQGVAVDSLGNVYLTDQDLGVIKLGRTPRKWSVLVRASADQALDRTSEQKTTIESPAGVAVDSSGSLFFADLSVHRIYRVALSNNSHEVIAGTGREGFRGNDGPARDAEFAFPNGLARDEKGNLFIADEDNCRIQVIDSSTGIITTVTGTEEGGLTCEQPGEAAFTKNRPSHLAVDRNGAVFFVQEFRGRVQRFNPLTRSITTVAGNGEWGFGGDHGLATKASLHAPEGIAIDDRGDIYIADSYNGRIRRVDAKTGLITTVAGNGPILADVQM